MAEESMAFVEMLKQPEGDLQYCPWLFLDLYRFFLARER